MKIVKIGVTGTRSGMTDFQRTSVNKFLFVCHISGKHHSDIEIKHELHHGDCVGVDVETAELAKKFDYKIVCHPPVKDDLRAFFKSDETREPMNYFARNRNIVDECDHLLVVPYQMEWQSNGGTWYTHDYAKKKGKPLTIFWPEQSLG